MDRRRWIFAAVPVTAAAALGGLGARGAPATYGRLRKPSWAPPARVFGPVWSALYVMIGAAGWRLFVTGSRRTRSLHLTQLALNAIWPIAFFSIRDKRASLVIIVLLDSTVATEVTILARQDRPAAALLVPYLAWSAFATALNVAVSDPSTVAGS